MITGRIIAVLILLTFNLCHATIKHEQAFWSGLDYDTALSENKPIHFDLMLQGRFSNSRNTLEQFFVRPSFYYRFENRLRVAIGYDYIPDYPERRANFIEQRVWPQLQRSFLLKPGLDLTLRSRFEYRTRSLRSAKATRFRQRVEFSYQRQHADWALDVFDEIFLGVTKPNWVSQRTIDQNRIFIGIVRKINQFVQVDLGYLTILRPRRQSRLTHIPLLAFELGVDKQAVRIRSV